MNRPFSQNIGKGFPRQHVRDHGHLTPFVVAGGIQTFDQAESILSSSLGDIGSHGSRGGSRLVYKDAAFAGLN